MDLLSKYYPDRLCEYWVGAESCGHISMTDRVNVNMTDMLLSWTELESGED